MKRHLEAISAIVKVCWLGDLSKVVVIVAMVSSALPASAQAGRLQVYHPDPVDKHALTFADGPATRFGSLVNGVTHQQSPITTYRQYQYVTYFDADRRLCVARKKLPDGQWEIIRFKDHRFNSNDSHNSTVLGICEKDGTIHMAFDHHATPLNYRVSKIGAAHNPESVRWTADLFGKVSDTLGAVKTDKRVTYPRFFSAPNGNLMLYYRGFTSGNGDGVVEEYDGDSHKWTRGMGKFISREIGDYTVDGETSNYRCPYLNSISYAGNRLHVSWIWRDRFERTNINNQHDLCYAYSDDDGRTWRNSDGEIIGKTGESFIHLNTPGLIVAPIPTNTGLSNQNTHYAYPDGSIHIMMLNHRRGSKPSHYRHHWRDRDGTWHFEALPFSGNRPKLVGDSDGSLVLVYEARGQLSIAKGTPNFDRSAWQWDSVDMPGNHSCDGDPLVDLELWELSQILSVYYQDSPAHRVETSKSEPVDGQPSALNVVYFRFAEKK